MKSCALLPPRRDLRRCVPARCSQWALVAALALSVLLTIWSDRASAQAVSLGSTGPASAADSGSTKINLNSLVPARGTKINLGSLVRQEAVPAPTPVGPMPNEVHFYEQLENQGENRRPQNSGAGDSSSEAAGQMAQRRNRASSGEWNDADYSDGDGAQERPAQLSQVQRSQMSNLGLMQIKH